MLIYLTGYMGSGKSRYGKVAARVLDYGFLDLDTLIEQEAGLSVNEIFSRHGESFFRALEQEILMRTLPEKQTILSTGGGTPCNEMNLQFMKQHGKMIYLKLHPVSLATRLKDLKDVRPVIRPHLPDPEAFITRHLAEREIWYLQADMVVKGEGLTGKNLAEYITHLL